MHPRQIAIFFPRHKSPAVERTLIQNLNAVFGNSLTISIVHADEVSPSRAISADLFLLMTSDGVNDLKGIVSNLDDTLTISRTIHKAILPCILAIPSGTDVLVVNDTYQLVMEFTNCLLGLGLTEINWIPYKEEEERAGLYRGIQLAICPNEKEMVPTYIPQVIDVGERFIDTYTMVRISAKLHLRTAQIEGQLLRYSELLAEPETSIAGQYFDNYRKSVLLEHHVHHGTEGLLLCDADYRCLYANEYLERLFPGTNFPDEAFAQRSLPQACAEEFYNGMEEIGGEHYLLTKKPVWLGQLLAGYCITLRDEKSIHDLGADLSDKLSKNGMQARYRFEDICHHSALMAASIDRARRAAATDYPVLIQGESGTGKELFAQSIHNASPRRAMPFVAVNCAAVPGSLLESELFGYEGGAFTGARKQGKAGLFDQASGGTLFLDEIGDMPPNLQALLLRALQEKQIMRVGGVRPVSVDVRVIAATNKRLYEEVKQNRFRADLYYRLNSLPLSIPSLRQRPEDIPLLLRHFLGEDWGSLTSHERGYLFRREWPGNVRQLENFSRYYKTIRSLEGFFEAEEEEAPPTESPLSLIERHTTPCYGIGRNTLLAALRQQGSKSSEAWLRTQLAELKSQGLITIGRGRVGCRITERGRQALRKCGMTAGHRQDDETEPPVNEV